MSDSLGTELPKEIARVRDEIMPMYESLGNNGKPALFLMRHDLDLASQAMVEQDLPLMIQVYERLRSWKA